MGRVASFRCSSTAYAGVLPPAGGAVVVPICRKLTAKLEAKFCHGKHLDKGTIMVGRPFCSSGVDWLA